MMKTRRKAIFAIGITNFQYLTPAYIVTAAFLIIGIYNLIASLSGAISSHYVDMANYLYVFSVIAPIIIVSRNFKRIMHLNASKRDFYLGGLFSYILSAAAISLIDILIFLLTKAAFDSTLVIWNLVDVFGWWEHGVLTAFVQQFSFLLLVEIFVHTLSSIQSRWYGWLTDILLAAVLIIFIPIPELREMLVKFFDLIIFNESSALQSISCLLISVLLYAVYVQRLRWKRV